MLKNIKKEINDFSLWFKILLSVMFVVYLCFWIFTFHLSSLQQERGVEVILPSAPKDSHEYLLLAESLMQGRGFEVEGRIETLRLPGYPLFVAVIKSFTGTYFAVTFAQIIFTFFSVFFVRKIGTVYSSKKVGEISASLLLINPVTITLSLLILTDVLFLFLLTLGFYLTIKINNENSYKKVFIASMVFVIAIYVRGMGIFALPILVLPVLVTKIPFKIQVKLAGIMVITIALSTLPWIARNYIQTNVASFNSFEAENLTFSIPKFLSSVNGTSEQDEINNFLKVANISDKVWQEYGGRNIIYAKQISFAGEKIILSQPFSYIKFHMVSSLPFLFPSSVLFMRDAYDSATGVHRDFKYGAINALVSGNWALFFQGIKEVWWKFAERIGWLLAYLIALFSVWKNRKGRLVWVCLFIFAYLMALSGPAAGPRLSFQAWPYIFLLFADGGVYVYQKFLSWKNPNSLSLQ